MHQPSQLHWPMSIFQIKKCLFSFTSGGPSQMRNLSHLVHWSRQTSVCVAGSRDHFRINCNIYTVLTFHWATFRIDNDKIPAKLMIKLSALAALCVLGQHAYCYVEIHTTDFSRILKRKVRLDRSIVSRHLWIKSRILKKMFNCSHLEGLWYMSPQQRLIQNIQQRCAN